MRALCATLLAGCFAPSYEHPQCGPNAACPAGTTCSAANVCERVTEPDAAEPDAYAYCLGDAPFRFCFAAPPAGDLTVPGIFDTGGASCDPVASTETACVFAGRTLRVTPISRATGPRALVLVATLSVTIDGKLDVSSRALSVGAGALLGPCDPGTPPQASVSGGAGGAGGSFGRPAGNGGTAFGVNAGIAAPPITNPTLRGGCPGQAGALGFVDQIPPAGGAPGGAVLVVAGESIAVNANIVAHGAGGSGAGPVSRTGGGGGGSGGMIVLHAPTITHAEYAGPSANGGGGGEGGSASSAGMPGADAGGDFALGGSGGSSVGGDGGGGGVGRNISAGNGGVASASPGAAGGGGGSSGIIIVNGELQ